MGRTFAIALQCGLCSGNCPLSLYMDYTPRRLMHLSREGFKDEVLRSNSIWLCTTCYNCMVQCPKGINITHLMYALSSGPSRKTLSQALCDSGDGAAVFPYGPQVSAHHGELG